MTIREQEREKKRQERIKLERASILASEVSQRENVSSIFTDVLIDELKKREYVVLAKQVHDELLDHRDEVLERTDIPT